MQWYNKVMGKIIQLDEQIANMIAAGEVVERPQGVVKELVENAIDANSTRIEVEVSEGGMEKIVVRDNGDGMSNEDAHTAFMRHATSKIKVEADLFEIHSLGFRGEAIPSIASVSKLSLITNDGNESTKIVMSYGKNIEDSAYPCNKGTEITVTGLFYKTPARLKHLRSDNYENSLIQDVMVRFALSHPEIAFIFTSNGKIAFRTSGNGNLLEVMYQAWGESVARNAIPVDFKDYDYHVTGYLVKPMITRSSRYFSHVYMNGRMVKTFRLYKAIEQGYEDFIVKGRYPMCVLNIEVDPQLLDVNVHPSKWEIRISKQNQLEYLLKDEIRRALQNALLAPRANMQEAVIKTAPTQNYYSQESFETTNKDAFVPNRQSAPINPFKQRMVQNQAMDVPKQEPVVSPYVKQQQVLQEIQTNQIQEVQMADQEAFTRKFPEMEVIGQLHDKFILCALPEGLAIVDQHAAQERVNFERFEALLSQPPVMMDLLLPLTFTVGHDVVMRVDELNEAIKDEIHITFEVFGSDVLRVSKVPAWMNNIDEKKFIQDVLENFINDAESVYTRMDHKRIATMACHASIRFNHALTMHEMQEAMRQLSECKNPYHCPHGRPTFIILNEKELTKEFLR